MISLFDLTQHFDECQILFLCTDVSLSLNNLERKTVRINVAGGGGV